MILLEYVFGLFVFYERIQIYYLRTKRKQTKYNINYQTNLAFYLYFKLFISKIMQ